MKLSYKLGFFVLSVVLAGCAGDTGKLSIGMDRAGVVAAMGSPLSVSGVGGCEILNYSVTDSTGRFMTQRPYQVRMIDGKVEAYGFSNQLPPLDGRGVAAAKTAALRVGMTKDEAIGIMGTPDYASSDQGVEYLHYTIYELMGAVRHQRPYLVTLVNGKVDAFGFGGGPVLPVRLRR